MKKIKFVSLVFLSFVAISVILPGNATADEFGDYLMFDCIPELSYMELTSTRSSNTDLTPEQKDKYGIVHSKEPITCSFDEYDLDVELNLTFEGTQKSPCAMSHWVTVDVLVNGHHLYTFKKFGLHCNAPGVGSFKQRAAPHLLALETGASGLYIHACTGRHTRECESYEYYIRNLKKQGEQNE